MLDKIRSCLNANGAFDLNRFSASTPRKAVLPYSSWDRSDFSQFCTNACQAIEDNIIIARAAFDGVKMTAALEGMEKLARQSDFKSALALSLLVHASKCNQNTDAQWFVGLALDCARGSYRLASSQERPTAELLAKARRYLLETKLKEVLCIGLASDAKTTVAGVEVEFAYLPNDEIMAWSAPSTAVLNVFVLATTMHLEHVIPLTILVGHEERHVLERWSVDDFNFSTPGKAGDSVPALKAPNREAGLGFELGAIGDKYNFSKPKDPEKLQELLRLLDAIENGILANETPALNAAQRTEFGSFKARYNEEMPFERALRRCFH